MDTSTPAYAVERYQLMSQADDAAHIIANQLGDGSQMDDGSPELAYFTLLALLDLVPKLTMPALTVSSDDDPDDDPVTVLVCPHCGIRTREITAVDGSIRHTSSAEMDGDNLTVTFDYGRSEDYDGVVYACLNCERPVSLPEGWAEV